MWTVTKDFSFEAAHSLPHLPEGHKCRNLHGHSYGVTIGCCGDLDAEKSWVVDYAQISAAVEPIIAQLDHQNLNDVLGITTTAENIAFWLWQRIKKQLPEICFVEVRETPKTKVFFQPHFVG